ncbi:hypothetical protein NBW16_14285, partial [Brucella abortus]
YNYKYMYLNKNMISSSVVWQSGSPQDIFQSVIWAWRGNKLHTCISTAPPVMPAPAAAKSRRSPSR